jgi:hypothetical protein
MANVCHVFLWLSNDILYIRTLNSQYKVNKLRLEYNMKREEIINDQREKVVKDQSKVVLFAPCRIGEGIMKLTESEWESAKNTFVQSNLSPTFFIPASGSGSRMFAFLFDFLTQADQFSDIGSIERFLNHLHEFAFYHLLPNDIKQKAKDAVLDAEELASYLLSENGLNFGNLPKGLIPFHYNEPFILNPFQEHVLQGTRLTNGATKFHFTIQPEFEAAIKQSIANLEGLTGKKYNVSFSTQNKESDAYAFTKDGAIAQEDGKEIRRPAGHGALLDNLNQLDEELIFIKNIDNVQHFNNSSMSMETWTAIGGILQQFRTALKNIQQQPSKEALINLNERYQFISPQELNGLKTEQDILNVINRPIRVCGMVRNEGQPGGGPFWIDDKGVITKQIVEKAQISHAGEQFRLMIKSTHFNPVMMALCPLNLNNEKLDLTVFKDESKYFVVNKMQKGQEISYIEQPGLWNGGMANWNTLFVEISQETFSPVKTVLDLLISQHRTFCHQLP